MSHTKKLLGKRIREFRKAQGLSQEELALKAGLDRSFVGKVERGEKNISIESLEKLAKALSVKISSILEGI